MKSIRKNLVVWTATASVLTLQACHLSCIDIWLKDVYGGIKIGLTLARTNFSFAGFQGQEKFSTHHTIEKEKCIYGSGTRLRLRSMKSNSSFATGSQLWYWAICILPSPFSFIWVVGCLRKAWFSLYSCSTEHSGSKLFIGIFNSCEDNNMKTPNWLLTIKAQLWVRAR